MASPVENIAKRKPSGGKRRPYRKRRVYEYRSHPAETTVGRECQLIIRRGRGRISKFSMKTCNYAIVSDPSTGKSYRAKVLRVVENPAGRDFLKKQIVTRGAILETEVGRARVTSRPGQDGCVNAVLLEKFAES